MQYAVDNYLITGIERTLKRVREANHPISMDKTVDEVGFVFIGSLENAVRAFNQAVITAEKTYRDALGGDGD